METGADRQIPQVNLASFGQEPSGGPHAGAKKRARPRKTEGNAKTLITRRRLLFGAAGVGALAAGAAGVAALSSQSDADEEIHTLSVAEEDVFDLESCSEIDAADAFELVGDYELPFGTLLWVDDGEVAACLLPTEEATPLVHVAALSLSTGNYFTVLESAVGAEEGFEIYDVRGNAHGFVWIEAAVMEGLWRIYTAPFGDFTLGQAQLVDEGGPERETPCIAVAGENAFWQTMAPVTNENARREPAAVRRAALAGGQAATIYESVGRMSAPLVGYEDSVVCTPRHKDATSYCDLLLLDGSTGRVLDQATLPSGMFPNQVAYGPSGFAFCFESIYDYGGGIANLGTYTPASPARDGYDGLGWFRFNRSPSAGPFWCTDSWFMVKSNQSTCAVNLENRLFCSLGVESGCLDWGDYLVSAGKRDTVVTATQIDQVDSDNKEVKKTKVRVWKPLAALPAHEQSDNQQTAEA